MTSSPHIRPGERPSKRALAQASRLARRQTLRPLSFRVLRSLDDRGFTSGVALARACAVSRSTIWAAVSDIERSGVVVLRGRGRGYRLLEPVSWIDPVRVGEMLGQAARCLHLTVIDHCESTNTALALQSDSGAPHGTVLLAEWQTAGRGRFDRRWSSVPGGSLTFSLLWRFEKGGAPLSGLSLAIGLAIADSLRSLGLREVRLKWPNDVLARGRKLAGVLAEIKGDVLGPCAAVIGIGLNVRLPQASLDRIDQPATDLARAGLVDVDRNTVLAALLSALASMLVRFEREGFAGCRPQWQAYSASLHKPVKVLLPDGEVLRGRMVGVDPQGALRIESGGTIQRIFSGELIVRGVSAPRGTGPPGLAARRPKQATLE